MCNAFSYSVFCKAKQCAGVDKSVCNVCCSAMCRVLQCTKVCKSGGEWINQDGMCNEICCAMCNSVQRCARVQFKSGGGFRLLQCAVCNRVQCSVQECCWVEIVAVCKCAMFNVQFNVQCARVYRSAVCKSVGGWINQGGEEMMDRVGLESQPEGNINREMMMIMIMMTDSLLSKS